MSTPSSRTVRTPGSSSSRRTTSSNVTVASSQHNAAVVIEIGTAHTRIGLAGESTPRHVVDTPELPLPSAGRSMSPAVMSEKKWEEILYPLMSRILTDLLLIKPRGRRVLIIEPFVSPTAFRTALCRVLLLWLNVPSVLFVSGGAVSVPYALGRTTPGSLIVDVGQWEGRVVCVSGGRYLIDTFQAVPCGFGNLVKAFMVQHNSTAPNDIPTSEDGQAILQQCLDSQEFVGGETCAINVQVPSTGQITTVNLQAVHDCLHDMYFDASNPETLVHALLSTFLICPVDLRVDMARNATVIGGGVVGIPSFERRLLKSLFHVFDPAEVEEKLFGTAAKFRVLEPALKNGGPLNIVHPLPFAPNVITWIGGSILGTLEMSDERWVYRQSFMEQDEENKEGEEKTDRGVSRIYDFLAVST